MPEALIIIHPSTFGITREQTNLCLAQIVSQLPTPQWGKDSQQNFTSTEHQTPQHQQAIAVVLEGNT